MYRYSCNLCTLLDGQSIDKIFLEEREKTAHAQLHLLQSKVIDPNATIEQVIGECFSRFGLVNVKNAECRSALLKFCKDLFASRSASGPVICQNCGHQLRLYNQVKKCWKTNVIIEHATSHLEHQPYWCRRCDFKGYTKEAIKQHLRNLHGERSNDYNDLSSAYDGKIKESIVSCFQEGAFKLHTTTKSVRNRNMIQGHMLVSGSELKVQRHLHGGALLETAARQNGKVFCRICSKSTALGGPYLIVLHAEWHLNKQLYQCKRCPKKFSTYWNIKTHVKNHHKISVTGTYVDQSDHFHAEIMEMLDKCFD